ncbi:hypothetical protein [Myroides sp. N17-2]|uniref:DUF7691 family protein n=1 Tax=Myroides sp. N17-2 TaxID=2030799 RepID=UPI000EFBAD9A|nr:hypothetical protein [Myroides sp. N17-2]
MGQYVQSYLTDKKKIQDLYGSGNLSLYEELYTALKAELDDLDGDFEDELEEHNISTKDILLDIIKGQTKYPVLAFMYGYVYEKLCQHYGEYFSPPNDEYSTPYYYDIAKEQEYKAFIPIPFSDDFPVIYSIAVEDLDKEIIPFIHNARRRSQMNKETCDLEQEDFQYAFEYAKAEHKDLVFFIY